MTMELSIWIDEDRETSVRVAAATLLDSVQYQGHASIPEPLEYRLPSGLLVTINCERLPAGVIHLGIEFNGELQMMMSFASDHYSLRVFPPEHSSFVVDLRPSNYRS